MLIYRPSLPSPFHLGLPIAPGAVVTQLAMLFKDALRIAFFAALSLTRSRTYPPPEPQAAFAQRYLGFRLFYCCRLLTRPQ
ncbi:hypothetical protein FKM82_011273 [Ascaphus truei]